MRNVKKFFLLLVQAFLWRVATVLVGVSLAVVGHWSHIIEVHYNLAEADSWCFLLSPILFVTSFTFMMVGALISFSYLFLLDVFLDPTPYFNRDDTVTEVKTSIGFMKKICYYCFPPLLLLYHMPMGLVYAARLLFRKVKKALA